LLDVWPKKRNGSKSLEVTHKQLYLTIEKDNFYDVLVVHQNAA
jgi:hypothetical protein